MLIPLEKTNLITGLSLDWAVLIAKEEVTK
jgi:hypothetical protein